MTFLSWFFPWSHLDSFNKIQMVLWFSQLVIACGIWFWAVLLNKPFMVSKKDYSGPDQSGGQQ